MVADMPIMGLRPQRAVALETLDLCAGLRESIGQRASVIQTAVRRHFARAAERFPVPTVIILVAIVAAICAGRHASPKTYNPVAGLSDEEYKRRYELGRRRYLEERAALKARKRAWRREHGPWLLLAVVAALLVLVLTVTQPHGLIVIMTLAFYTGLAWVVCWVVRASC